MNTRYNLRMLGIGGILTLLFCAGIFFYSRWDHQRFVAGLPQPPKSDVSPEPMERRESSTKERPGQTPPSATVAPQRLEEQSIVSEVPDMEMEEVTLEETSMPARETEVEPPSLSTVQLPEVLPNLPVEGIEFGKTKAAWQEYNGFLTTDPDYAYAKLAEGFREMYGNHPEIDIIVENIRRANEGTLTVDDAIALMTAALKVMPADQTVVIDQVSEKLELLHDLKAFESEGGKPTVTFNISVGEE